MINYFESIRIEESDTPMTSNLKIPFYGYENIYVKLTKPNKIYEKKILTNTAYI
jgi:hypothetical protein